MRLATLSRSIRIRSLGVVLVGVLSLASAASAWINSARCVW